MNVCPVHVCKAGLACRVLESRGEGCCVALMGLLSVPSRYCHCIGSDCVWSNRLLSWHVGGAYLLSEWVNEWNANTKDDGGS